MSRYSFHTLDVFTDKPFGGNPLAVVLDADPLRGEQMQAIAAEFNLSEAVFVLKPVLAGYLHDQASHDGARRWLSEQGFAMGRPSLIELEADISAGRIAVVRVGGASVFISDGWINVG